MTDLPLIDEIRRQDPEIADVMEAFEGIDVIYQEALKSMGLTSEREETVRNSADVTVSFTRSE